MWSWSTWATEHRTKGSSGQAAIKQAVTLQTSSPLKRANACWSKMNPFDSEEFSAQTVQCTPWSLESSEHGPLHPSTMWVMLTDISRTHYLSLIFWLPPQTEISQSRTTVDMVLSLRNWHLSKITVLFLHAFFNYKLPQILSGRLTTNKWKWLTLIKA